MVVESVEKSNILFKIDLSDYVNVKVSKNSFECWSIHIWFKLLLESIDVHYSWGFFFTTLKIVVRSKERGLVEYLLEHAIKVCLLGFLWSFGIRYKYVKSNSFFIGNIDYTQNRFMILNYFLLGKAAVRYKDNHI